jgi:hypothetical protein
LILFVLIQIEPLIFLMHQRDGSLIIFELSWIWLLTGPEFLFGLIATDFLPKDCKYAASLKTKIANCFQSSEWKIWRKTLLLGGCFNVLKDI